MNQIIHPNSKNLLLFLAIAFKLVVACEMRSGLPHPESKKVSASKAVKSLESFKFEVTGKVQGVFFRKYTQVVHKSEFATEPRLK